MNTFTTAIVGNWVCWVILVLAFGCYQTLAVRFFHVRKGATAHTGQHVLIYISALPLLGLFGTITGLLACFNAMAAGGVGEAITGGIGRALFTTQLGLVCAIPAWVLHAFVEGLAQQQCTRKQPSWEAHDAIAS